MISKIPGRARLSALLVPVLALAACLPALAEEGEFYVNTYRDLGRVSPLGPRSAAMGRTGRGLADGVASLGVNPAALGAFQGTGVDVSLGFDWLDDGYDDATQTTFKLGGAASLDRWSNRICFSQAVGALLETKHYSGASDNDMKREQTGVLMAYGLRLTDDLLAGVSVALFDGKMTGDHLYDADGNVVRENMDRKFIGGDFKLGGLYRLGDDTTWGGTIGYTTGSLKERAEYARANGGRSGTLDRYSIGAGFAHQYAECTMIMGDIWYERLSSDVPGVLDESNRAWGLSVGVEQAVVPDVIALRGGLYYDKTSYKIDRGVSYVGDISFSNGRFGITAGLGVKLYSFDLGYSLDVNSGGDVKNLLDVSTEW